MATPEGRLQELAERLAAAERASAEKTRFIRHVSHEFRTPLSSIIGFTALLEREGEALTPEERAEYLRIVVRNARHLLHIVNDLLNISKVEAGTLEVTLAPVRAGQVAEAVIASLANQAEENGIRVRLEDAATLLVEADSGRLRQVLFNLLENALKYSPRGSEVVVATTDGDGVVRLEVRDRGPGIPRVDQGRLFKEFSRVNPPGMRVAGAGLGLALSRLLTKAMHGEIGVDSAPGQGSTFWVALRPAVGVAAVAPAPAVAASAPPARGELVAVVDDDGDVRAYAATVLRRAGYPVVTDDGSPGCGARLAGAQPHLVLLDLHLGDRLGRELLAELRAHLSGTPPVLAFTAGTAHDDEVDGFAGVVLKPVEPDALVARVDGTLAAARPDAREAVPEEEDDFLAPLRARFRAGLPERLASIERYASAGDRAGLRRELHKLKGAAAGYGLDALAELAQAAEDVLRDGERLPVAVDALTARMRQEAASR